LLRAGFRRRARSARSSGTTVPTSFLRLVPHQEAPTSVCWGERNRSVLVRVPLGWTGVGDRMIRDANPAERPEDVPSFETNQTVELRSPDGSAHVHLLLAGMAVAARYGLEHPDALRVARELSVEPGAAGVSKRQRLPASCHEAAECLKADRARYEEGGVFPAGLIDSITTTLKGYDDEHLSDRLVGDAERLSTLVQRHLHCG
jgi:glutamine synthetase